MTAKNYVDASGLTLETRPGIVTDLENGMKTIYGADINLDPNSPDEQMVQLIAQAKIDVLDVVAQVYSVMSPTNAVGAVLDRDCALNDVQRRAATYTVTPCTLTATLAVTLKGLDTYPDNPFTVKDTSGNVFYLAVSTTTTAGANVLNFRAATAGLVSTTIGTITTIVTVTLGITAVNNPSVASYTGVAEETDPKLRLRRQLSVAKPSQGFPDAIRAALLNTMDVTDAQVYENVTSVTDVHSVPPHAIWAIVEGGTDAAVALAIYSKRNGGCDMAGSTDVDVAQANGTNFTVSFDRPTPQALHVSFTVGSLQTAHTVDTVFLATEIAARMVYAIGEAADFSAIAALVKTLDPLAIVVTSAADTGVSATAGSYVATPLDTTTVANKWVLSSSNITIATV